MKQETGTARCWNPGPSGPGGCQIEKLEEIVLQIRCGEILNDGEAADLLDDAIGEIERLRVALKKIAEVNPDDTSSMCWVVKVANAALVTPNAGSNGPSGVAAKVRVD